MLYDEDGYEMDSEDDEDGKALAAANEFYPYNDVRMEGQNKRCLPLLISFLTLWCRVACAIDISYRPTKSPNIIEAVHLKNAHRTYSECEINDAEGKGYSMENEAPSDKAERGSHMGAYCST